MARRDQLFETITTEGALLPSDFLQRLAQRDREIPGLTPDAYHLGGGEKLNEAISRSWNRLLGVWKNFSTATQALAPTDAGTTLTREKWLLPLFQELGYGRLQTAKPFEFDDRKYSISHGWQAALIHLVSFRADLDERSESIVGARRSTPHSMVQEFLNRSDAHLWGIVSNGLRLRLLRDNVSITRQAYVEFDLEGMMQGELYADFALLWLLLHQSRVEGERPELCWLEKWTQEARQQGERVLDHMRDGVQDAITALGQGFLAHPANTALRDRLRSGELTTQDYFRQLLRVVYRLLFLCIAEDRDLLHAPGVSVTARERYRSHYSISRLRRMAQRLGGTQHSDLWHIVQLIVRSLGSKDGCPALGLTGLGSFLWSERATPALADCQLPNRQLLQSIRSLAYTQQGRFRRPVDYKNIGSQEFGSVYESLLEQHPKINLDAATFTLGTHAGNERKTSGSHYTPPPLVNCLLDSALEPVLQERERDFAKLGFKTAEEAILSLKVCDEAVGSGHFLIGAAHRIAKRLAAVRTGDGEPAPAAIRHALRDVIGRCLYGVDINPMAVELCKFALWLEALEPGKPLSFLDHHIQCGNSLLGATPALMAQGIPDAAFKAIEGDDDDVCREAKRQNKDELDQLQLFHGTEVRPWMHLGNLPAAMLEVERMTEDSVVEVERKESRYSDLVRSTGYLSSRFLADAWCAAFVWRKTKEFPFSITNDVLRRIERNPHDCPAWMREETKRLADHYGFFHWHLTFPEVFPLPASGQKPVNELCGWNGGFDVNVGNPPWDTLSPDAKEFFSAYDPQVRHQDKDGQALTIEKLLQNPAISSRWQQTRRDLFATVHFIKDSGRYRLFAEGNLGKGDFNIYRMFVETALQNTRTSGFSAQFVPEGIYNGANCAAIRNALFSTCTLSALLGFENAREVWFTGIDTRTKFALYVARIGGTTDRFHACFNIRSIDALNQIQRGVGLRVPVSMVREFSPDALAVMEFGDQRDIDIALKMYGRCPKFGDEAAGLPMRTYMREFDMGGDREVFGDDPNGLPLYEGRMVDQFDHRAKGYRSGRGRSAVWEELPFGKPDKSIQPQWRVPLEDVPDKVHRRMNRYRIGFCDVASPTNERSLIAALLPPGAVSGDKVPTILFTEGWDWACLVWVAVANSFAMDFLARKKVALKMSYTVLDSLPFPRLSKDNPLARHLVPLALRLTCCGSEMTACWNALALDGWVQPVPADGPSPGVANETERLKLRAELDAVVARDVFGLTTTEMDYILETFPIWRGREEKRHGEFRTRRLILEAMAAGAIEPAGVESVQTPRFDHERVNLEVGDYVLGFVFSLLRYSGGTADLMRLVRGYALLQQPKVLASLVEAQFDASARKWVTSSTQPHDVRWFLPILRRMETHDAVSFEVRGDDVIVHQKDPQGPRVDAAIGTDAFLVMRVLDIVPDQAIAATVKRIVPKAPRVSLQEAMIPA